MSKCIVARINMEAPEKLHPGLLSRDIQYWIDRFYVGEGKIIKSHTNYSLPINGTRDIRI